MQDLRMTPQTGSEEGNNKNAPSPDSWSSRENSADHRRTKRQTVCHSFLLHHTCHNTKILHTSACEVQSSCPRIFPHIIQVGLIWLGFASGWRNSDRCTHCQSLHTIHTGREAVSSWTRNYPVQCTSFLGGTIANNCGYTEGEGRLREVLHWAELGAQPFLGPAWQLSIDIWRSAECDRLGYKEWSWGHVARDWGMSFHVSHKRSHWLGKRVWRWYGPT